MKMTIGAVEQLSGAQQLDLIVLKAKTQAIKVYFQKMKEITDKFIGEGTNVLSTYTWGLQVVLQCRTMEARQSTQTKMKTRLAEAGLDCKVILGTPALKKIMESPCTSLWWAFKEAQKADGCVTKPALVTKWPRSYKGAWGIQTPQGIWKITGVPKHGTMTITIAQTLSTNGTTIQGLTLKAHLEKSMQLWTNYPFEIDIEIADVNQLDSPFE